MQSAFIPISLILSKLYSLNPQFLVAQWRAHWTSNPEVAGSKPTVDDFGFRCFRLFQYFTSNKNCLCFTQNKIQMNDDKMSSSERPRIYGTKKCSDNCSWKENTQPETESATFFPSIKLCTDDKLFSTTEDTNSGVQNQKTTFDSLEHSAISDRLHF